MPLEQYERVAAVRACAEAAGRLADVLGEVHPALRVCLAHHLLILRTHYRKSVLDVLLRLLDRDRRRVRRVDGELQVGVGHAVETVYLLKQLRVLAHMRRELGCDEVYLAVVHLAGDLLSEQQAVEHRVESAQGRHRLFLLHLRVISGGGHVLVLAQLAVERLKRGAAHLGVRVVLVAVLVERVAERVLLAVGGEAREAHIGELCHVVYLLRRAEGGAESGERALGLGA